MKDFTISTICRSNYCDLAFYCSCACVHLHITDEGIKNLKYLTKLKRDLLDRGISTVGYITLDDIAGVSVDVDYLDVAENDDTVPDVDVAYRIDTRGLAYVLFIDANSNNGDVLWEAIVPDTVRKLCSP